MHAAPGCWASYCTVLGWLASVGEQRAEIGQELVDSYAAQHPTNTERRNRQSVAVHLVSLCAAVDNAMPAEGRRKLIGRLAHRDYPVLEPVATSFAVTIRDVVDASGRERAGVARAWAEATWIAWSPHHAQLRSWLAEVR
jgi:hypothetical protein